MCCTKLTRDCRVTNNLLVKITSTTLPFAYVPTEKPPQFFLRFFFLFFLTFLSTRGRDSSAGRATDWKARRSTDAVSSPRCGKEFFSQNQLPVQTLLRYPHSPSVLLLAPTPVRTLKIPNTGSYAIVWIHVNTIHILIGMGTQLLRLLCLTQVRQPEFSAMDKK